MQVSDFPLGYIFALCSLFLALAACCQYKLSSITSQKLPQVVPHSQRLVKKVHVSDDGLARNGAMKGLVQLQEMQG